MGCKYGDKFSPEALNYYKSPEKKIRIIMVKGLASIKRMCRNSEQRSLNEISSSLTMKLTTSKTSPTYHLQKPADVRCLKNHGSSLWQSPKHISRCTTLNNKLIN